MTLSKFSKKKCDYFYFLLFLLLFNLLLLPRQLLALQSATQINFAFALLLNKELDLLNNIIIENNDNNYSLKFLQRLRNELIANIITDTMSLNKNISELEILNYNLNNPNVKTKDKLQCWFDFKKKLVYAADITRADYLHLRLTIKKNLEIIEMFDLKSNQLLLEFFIKQTTDFIVYLSKTKLLKENKDYRSVMLFSYLNYLLEELNAAVLDKDKKSTDKILEEINAIYNYVDIRLFK